MFSVKKQHRDEPNLVKIFKLIYENVQEFSDIVFADMFISKRNYFQKACKTF